MLLFKGLSIALAIPVVRGIAVTHPEDIQLVGGEWLGD